MGITTYRNFASAGVVITPGILSSLRPSTASLSAGRTASDKKAADPQRGVSRTVGESSYHATQRLRRYSAYRFYKTVVTRPRIGRDNDETKDFVGMANPPASPARGTSSVRGPKIFEPRGLAMLILGLAPVFDKGVGDRETKYSNLPETRIAHNFSSRR
jgi:hypothetical protein